MDDKLEIEISLPPDDDGFVALECPHCGERFKLRPDDVESDEVLFIYCPSCGLTSNSFIPEEAAGLAHITLANTLKAKLYDDFKKLERKTKSNPVSLKADKHPKEEQEIPLMPTIEGLMSVRCRDCGREAKVSPFLAMSIYTCPCCGIGQLNER